MTSHMRAAAPGPGEQQLQTISGMEKRSWPAPRRCRTARVCHPAFARSRDGTAAAQRRLRRDGEASGELVELLGGRREVGGGGCDLLGGGRGLLGRGRDLLGGRGRSFGDLGGGGYPVLELGGAGGEGVDRGA